MTQHRLSDFDYDLPDELIAQTPAPERTASRLLVVGHPESGGQFFDRHFTDLVTFLKAGDLLVFNDSKVIPARLQAHKESGGAVEILIDRITGDRTALVMMRASKKPGAGAKLLVSRRPERHEQSDTSPNPDRPRGEPMLQLTVLGRDPAHHDRFALEFPLSVLDFLAAYGELPLPPYIHHRPDSLDANRYQTIYAQQPGSIAAPTAGLHFDQPLIDLLEKQGVKTARVTLHVGSGTFAPVRQEDLSLHRMHSERCSMSVRTVEAIIQTRARGGRVIAVGTTSLRTLESAWAQLQSPDKTLGLPGQWETDLFITPGYSFKIVDILITNFHLPRSTLTILVSAFSGLHTIKKAYAHAIRNNYRFFSYGDCMLLYRNESPTKD